MSERHLRVADVFRCGWADYDRTHAIAPHQARAVRHLLRCRTAALGGHLHRCDRCGREVPLYNSCQDRHCPSCGTSAKERWLDARAAELLPVRYFHCVYPKCTARADRALDYLGRYTHKTAIGDHRLRSLENGQVTYTWRDRADGNAEKLDTLPVAEFIERFLYHILPPGVRRIRYYGWLAPARKRRILPAIRAALHVEPPVPAEGDPAKEPLVERILRRTGVDLRRCPFCGEGRLVNTRIRIVPYHAQAPPLTACA